MDNKLQTKKNKRQVPMYQLFNQAIELLENSLNIIFNDRKTICLKKPPPPPKKQWWLYYVLHTTMNYYYYINTTEYD